MTIHFENWNLDIIPTIVISILIPLSIYFTFWLFITGIIGGIRMLQSKNWISTKGKIISTEIKYKDFNDDGRKSRRYVKEKTYVYTVGGKFFMSNQTLASDSLYAKEYKSLKENTSKSNNIKIFNSLKSGERIENIDGEITTVYYNPRKPHIACLENRFNAEILLPIFMGLLFGVGIIYLTYFLIKPLIE